MINDKLKEAFNAYVRASYSDSFDMRQDGDTITSLVLRMTVLDVENMWNRFVLDLRDTLIA